MLGRCGPVENAELAQVRGVFLDVQKDAVRYVDFADFAFFRLEPIQIRYVGGFGRMSWVLPEAYARAFRAEDGQTIV